MNEPKKDCAYCNGTGVDPNSSNCLCMYGMETPSKKTAPTTVRAAYQIKEVWEQVNPKELAELREKAAKWDELMATIKRLKIC